MNVLSMAGKNLRKNASFYALYLISSALVVMIFYAFTAFAMNQVMLDKISENGRVESMCRVISAFLMLFVLFYMNSSNRFFLKRRARELGIYALLGYRKRRIAALLTAECFLLCILAFTLGVLMGAVLHKGIVLGLTALLDLSIDGKIPFLQAEAVGKTGAFVLLVVLTLVLSNAVLLRRASLLEFLRFEKTAEAPRKPRVLPAFLGLALILLGYVLSLDILRGRDSLWVRVGFYSTGLLTLLCVTVGTVLFISAFLPYSLLQQKKKIRRLYTPERLIVTSGFLYRIRTNAKALILLTLLSAAVLTISSVMALTLYYPIAAVSRMAPSELELRLEEDGQLEEVQTLVSAYAPHANVSFLRTELYPAVSNAQMLPEEYSLGTAKGDAENEKILRQPGFECISETSFRALLQAQGKTETLASLPHLGEGESILVKYQPNPDGSDETGAVYPLEIGGETVPVTVKAVTLDNPISFANSVGTLILSDSLYDRLSVSAAPLCVVLSLNGAGLRDNEALYAALQELLHDSPYLQGNSHRVHVLFSLNSSTFLLIGFLVVLFFIAVGSTLYFNNVSAVADSQDDYTILRKLGYGRKRLRRILKRQVLCFFSVPFLLGLLDCVFATLVYRRALMQDLLGNRVTQYFPALLAVGLTAGIMLAYYWLTVQSCDRLLHKNET